MSVITGENGTLAFSESGEDGKWEEVGGSREGRMDGWMRRKTETGDRRVVGGLYVG